MGTSNYPLIEKCNFHAPDRIVVKQRRRLASRMHPDKGGDAHSYQEMQKAAEVLLEATAAWRSMADTFPTVCICCYCSICLDFYRNRVGMCSSCLGIPKKNQGHQNCGLSKVTSYFMRYNKDPAVRGRWYCLISHGCSEEEAKARIQAAAAKKKGKRTF